MTEPVRVKRIEVRGLFGLYDHTIDMKLEDRVTILHGPNGIGKTSLLRMVAAVIRGDAPALSERPFRSLHVGLTDGGGVDVEPWWGDRGEPSWPPRAFNFSRRGAAEGHQFSVWAGDQLAGPYARGPHVPVENRPQWLKDLSSQLPVLLVDTHRLLIQGKQSIATVDWIAEDLASKLSAALTRYANEVQEQSRTFPQRFLRSRAESMPREDLRARVKRMQSELDRLNRLGLLESAAATSSTASLSDAELDGADPTKLSFMTQYLTDQEAALDAFKDFAARVELFESAIGTKIQDKTIRAVQKEGFMAQNRRGVKIPLSALSSGEQHEIVLFYELLFLSSRGTLVLIDEPEISIHILWQKQLIADVLEIAKLAELDVLLATHSPFIVDDRSDLLVPLTAEAA